MFKSTLEQHAGNKSYTFGQVTVFVADRYGCRSYWINNVQVTLDEASAALEAESARIRDANNMFCWTTPYKFGAR